jgi:hypothetical protein
MLFILAPPGVVEVDVCDCNGVELAVVVVAVVDTSAMEVTRCKVVVAKEHSE